MSERESDLIRRKTVRWTFAHGPMAGIPFEHAFNQDGSVVWRILAGTMKGGGPRKRVRCHQDRRRCLCGFVPRKVRPHTDCDSKLQEQAYEWLRL